MKTTIGKREFMHHASQYLKLAETGHSITITHNGRPTLRLTSVKPKTPRDLIGFAGKVTVIGDINEPILGEFLDDFT